MVESGVEVLVKEKRRLKAISVVVSPSIFFRW
jgi:hypothetical protein